MLQATALTLDTTLSRKVISPFFLLQYADDTLVFSSAEGHTLRALYLTLQLFQNVSGLTVNAAKSSFVPCNLSFEACNLLMQLFHFQHADFPLQYLGLPLTVTRPTRDCFQPLLDIIEKKLAGWKGRLLSRSGRLVLVSSVLSSIPSYAMSSFLLPTWLVDAIDKVRKRFLWGTNTSGRQKIHLITWNRICLPKSHGGLGLLDFKLHNRALLLRWVWKLYTCRQSLWFALASNLFSARRGCKSPALWVSGGSFFWRDLRSLFPLFQLSTRVTVQSGVDTSFWYDNWGGKPLSFLFKGVERPPKSGMCLKDGLQDALVLLPLPRQLETHSILAMAPTVLSPGRIDALRWRWSPDGRFSVATTYKCLSTAGKLGSPLNWIWSLKAPPSLKLFLYLLSNDRLLTRQQLSKRGIMSQGGCALCDSDLLEDSLHLFFECPFSAQLRLRLHTLYNTPAVVPSHSTKEAVLFFFKGNNLNDFQLTLLATSLYALWLERNNRTFRSSTRAVPTLLEWIMAEARSYFFFLLIRTGAVFFYFTFLS
ncbi:RNA-directed DNA polymerase (reverse transcriptase)-related family protein [Rhynchospora pubera]|uniref:RNA-directed DNA polymerase (Reverse transcriptase)-related family protein n=1 Tax=Rhynchospora pubera TaxID=906938 RepID=A0AAV8GW22_9POAL|nr:RNA-directed DNA polymerase (reverse transcriptase)-related family protein [Rhynchospora pubera]